MEGEIKSGGGVGLVLCYNLIDCFEYVGGKKGIVLEDSRKKTYLHYLWSGICVTMVR